MLTNEEIQIYMLQRRCIPVKLHYTGYVMSYVLLYVSNSMTLIVRDIPSLVEGKEELTFVDRFSLSGFPFFHLVFVKPDAFTQPDLFAKHSSLNTTDLPARVAP